VGDNNYGQCDVSGWCDIVAVAAGNVHMATNTGNAHTIGLKSDGTVAAVGNNRYGQCNVSGWRDIVAVAAGDNEYGQCDVSGWRGIQLTGNIKVK
jgi:hypothetical protein